VQSTAVFIKDCGTVSPSRSVDRKQSLVVVSRKREYFKYPPETIGDSAPEVAKFGLRRPSTNPQKRLRRAFLRLFGVEAPGAGLAG
jgi:hypothetical protein